MANLEISAEDGKLLREALESAVSELRYEINNTDAHEYRDKLREKQAALERVLDQLASL